MMVEKILLITGNYLPGYKAGGPIQSVRGFAWLLKNNYEINILTRDRDLGDENSYSSVLIDEWNIIEQIKTMYINSKKMTSLKFLNLFLSNNNYDLIYLQSFFDSYTRKILLLKRLRLINSKILLAPRGEFGKGALEKGKIKKRTYLALFKFFKFDKNIIWQATSEEEEKNIMNKFKNSKIYLLNNIKKIEFSSNKKIIKELNEIKLIFISRIVEHKNLYFLLNIIEKLKNKNYKISLDIYGPVENEEYWKKCEKKIFKISEDKNIQIKYNGSLKNEEVIKTIQNYHYLVLPTKGENFGHIIMEAFIARTPVIISDRTPWRSLNDNNIGYDISLENKELWVSIMENIIKQTDDQYKNQICSIKTYCDKNFDIDRKRDEYLNALEEIFRGKLNNV